MPDQIALDKFTAAIAALLFSATAALAQDRLTKQDLVTLAVTLGVYDNRCEISLPGCWPMYSAWSECSIRPT
jgi:hypothetical protein